MSEDKILYCENCRHYVPTAQLGAEYARCVSPRNVVTKDLALSLVTRDTAKKPVFVYCVALRDAKTGLEDVCGPEGAWFESALVEMPPPKAEGS